MDPHKDLGRLQKLRSMFIPQLPPALQGGRVRVSRGEATSAAYSSDEDEIRKAFRFTYGQPLVQIHSEDTRNEEQLHPLATRVGVLFAAEESPGAHNVVAGIFDGLKAHNLDSILLGFVGGFEGLFGENTLEVTDDLLRVYRNQGGCDLLGQATKKILSFEQMENARISCTKLKLDGLVIIGGCSANTDAAKLAEYFKSEECQTKVVGVPVTLEGDLKNDFIETDVGFDTVCKVNSQLISNICLDALSAGKYYFFIRLMGKEASHVALECALQSHPNLVILGEDVAKSKMTLSQVVNQICDAVQARADNGKYHGVIILPEGLIEDIVDMGHLMKEIKGLLRQGISTDNISPLLSPWAASLFKSLPPFTQIELLQEMETEGLAYLSHIQTEKLLAKLVEQQLGKRKKAGVYTAKNLDIVCHFFGYQSRGSLPSNFDCNYAYALGQIAAHLIANGLNGYMATVTNLNQPVSKWKCAAVPLTAMMTIKRRSKDHTASVDGEVAIHAEKVNLKGRSHGFLEQNGAKWLVDDSYTNPGPIQYEGPGADSRTRTLLIEDKY
eukprot:Gb_16045 [translate_table: standard]